MFGAPVEYQRGGVGASRSGPSAKGGAPSATAQQMAPQWGGQTRPSPFPQPSAGGIGGFYGPQSLGGGYGQPRGMQAYGGMAGQMGAPRAAGPGGKGGAGQQPYGQTVSQARNNGQWGAMQTPYGAPMGAGLASLQNLNFNGGYPPGAQMQLDPSRRQGMPFTQMTNQRIPEEFYPYFERALVRGENSPALNMPGLRVGQQQSPYGQLDAMDQMRYMPRQQGQTIAGAAAQQAASAAELARVQQMSGAPQGQQLVPYTAAQQQQQSDAERQRIARALGLT